MQVMDDAALEWASASRIAGFDHEQAFDPDQHPAGSYYLAKLLRRYTNTDDLAPMRWRTTTLAGQRAGGMKGGAVTNSAAFWARRSRFVQPGPT